MTISRNISELLILVASSFITPVAPVFDILKTFKSKYTHIIICINVLSLNISHIIIFTDLQLNLLNGVFSF